MKLWILIVEIFFWGVETAYFENGNLRLSQNIKAVMKVITDYFLWQK